MTGRSDTCTVASGWRRGHASTCRTARWCRDRRGDGRQTGARPESGPPARYGGTERVVSTLTEELVRRGHQVTLFASGDSHTSAQLVPTVPEALWHRRPRPVDFS